jgi:epoxyqueuosine reductase
MRKMVDYQEIIGIAQQLDFDACGTARAETVDTTNAQAFCNWLQQGHHAEMAYMERNVAARLHPQTWYESIQSWIVLLWQYQPQQWQNPQLPQIACFAYGEDYHRFLKKKLRHFLQLLQKKSPTLNGICVVDTSPVLERYWAVRAGLGFVGNNSMLIHPTLGSFVFVALLALNDTISHYDKPLQQSVCDNCNRCTTACPTRAIASPRTVDARKCIAYLTIEKPHCDKARATRNDTQWDTHGYIFGCDICQKICPYNQKSIGKNHAENDINHQLINLTANDWKSMTATEFKALVQHSPLKRAGLEGIKLSTPFSFQMPDV